MKKDLLLIPTKIEAELVTDKKKILISGIGKTTIKRLEAIHKKTPISKAVLIGFAGRLDDELKINETYNITKVCDGKNSLELSAINSIWETASLVTTTKMVCTLSKKLELSQYAQLVDMESFYFTEFCIENNILPYVIRIISDDCDAEVYNSFISGSFKRTKLALSEAVKIIEPLLSL